MVNKGYKQTREHKEKIGLFRKNKTYEEIYGIEKAKGIKNKLSKSHMGQFPSKNNLEKRSESMLRLMNDERRKNISLNLTGRKVSSETRLKIRLANLGHPSSFKGKHHTEETKEKLRQFNKGKKHLDKTKQKLKIARSKQIFPIKDTLIEIKIQNFLKQLNIEFFTHQNMAIEHSYQCDILILPLNLVIECDGNYWHKYPTGREIDHIRTSELIDKGFRVLRLWEIDIGKMDLSDFMTKINEKLPENMLIEKIKGVQNND